MGDGGCARTIGSPRADVDDARHARRRDARACLTRRLRGTRQSSSPRRLRDLNGYIAGLSRSWHLWLGVSRH